jgi:hypothetical protein
MEQCQQACVGDKKFRLANLAINYPRGTVRFTEESYFSFIFRSLDETERWIETGRMIPPPSNAFN